jgi:hypothetical protein
MLVLFYLKPVGVTIVVVVVVVTICRQEVRLARGLSKNKKKIK